MRKLVDQVLEGLPLEPEYEDEFRVEEEICERAERLAADSDLAELAEVLGSVLNDILDEGADRGFAEGDLAAPLARLALQEAVLRKILALLRQMQKS